jgi:CDGSH-type Zn-finger protein
MSLPKKITVAKNGPYLVSGEVPLAKQTIAANHAGESTGWVEGEAFASPAQYALCRCGASAKKPYCDGTHSKIGFDGSETASRKPFLEQAELLDGPVLALADAQRLCAFGRFCDPHGQVWSQVERTDHAATRATFLKQVNDCPAGRLVAIDKATGQAIEPALPQSIGVVEDPAQGCSGPLWVRGGVPLIGADGHAYEVRNRMTLCRCGKSDNKPFCNGAHAGDEKFRDGL